jgi:hypothetical protein
MRKLPGDILYSLKQHVNEKEIIILPNIEVLFLLAWFEMHHLYIEQSGFGFYFAYCQIGANSLQPTAVLVIHLHEESGTLN